MNISKFCRALAEYALLTTILMLIHTGIASANSDAAINKILAMESAPDGVVFEVVSGKENYLQTALDKYDRYKKQLREKFPELDLAIVTHGSEQFSLTTANRDQYAETHQRVQRINDDEVPVHICETHASWRDITAADYPDYVNVAAQGPAQIRDYQELGYVLVVL